MNQYQALFLVALASGLNGCATHSPAADLCLTRQDVDAVAALCEMRSERSLGRSTLVVRGQ